MPHRGAGDEFYFMAALVPNWNYIYIYKINIYIFFILSNLLTYCICNSFILMFYMCSYAPL